MEAMQREGADPDFVHIVNMDETGMRSIRSQRTSVPVEKLLDPATTVRTMVTRDVPFSLGLAGLQTPKWGTVPGADGNVVGFIGRGGRRLIGDVRWGSVTTACARNILAGVAHAIFGYKLAARVVAISWCERRRTRVARMRRVPVEKRAAARCILLLDRASFHEAFAGRKNSGHVLGDIVQDSPGEFWVHFIPACATKYLQPIDTSGIIKRVKCSMRRAGIQECEDPSKNSSKASSSTAKSKASSAKNQCAGAAGQTCGPASASFLQKLAAKRERELEGFVDKEVFVEKKLRQVIVRGFPVTILTEGGRPTVDRLLREVKEEPASQKDDGATQPATSPTTSNPFAGDPYEDEFMEEIDNEHIADEEHQNKRNEVYRIDGTRTDDGMHIQAHAFLFPLHIYRSCIQLSLLSVTAKVVSLPLLNKIVAISRYPDIAARQAVQYMIMPSKKKPSCTLGRLGRWDEKRQPLLTLEQLAEREALPRNEKMNNKEMQTCIEFSGIFSVKELAQRGNEDRRLIEWCTSKGAGWQKELQSMITLTEMMTQKDLSLIEHLIAPLIDSQKEKGDAAGRDAVPSGKKKRKTNSGAASGDDHKYCGCGGLTRMKWARCSRYGRCGDASAATGVFFFGTPGSGKSYVAVYPIQTILDDNCFCEPSSSAGAYPQTELGKDPLKKAFAMDEATISLLAGLFGDGTNFFRM
eukprot:g19683.t1